MANRHLARSIVLQSLFEWDFRKRPDFEAADIAARNAREFAPGMSDLTFVKGLVKHILERRQDLDTIIVKAAPEWPLEKISNVDRNVLRIGLYELLFADRSEVPAKVAINEAIELAKTFGGDSSGKFVNGVLGSVYKELGEPGKEAPPRGKSSAIDPSKMPVERLAGAIVYARKDDDMYLALVHDIFGHWTLSKGHLTDGEDETDGVKRVIREEIGLSVEVEGSLGKNEYVASDPKKGKIRKQVSYYLAKSPFVEVNLAKSGGLDDAKWFKLADILDLNFYNDILPLITRAVQQLADKK